MLASPPNGTSDHTGDKAPNHVGVMVRDALVDRVQRSTLAWIWKSNGGGVRQWDVEVERLEFWPRAFTASSDRAPPDAVAPAG